MAYELVANVHPMCPACARDFHATSTGFRGMSRLCAMPRDDRAHRLDQLGFLHRELRGTFLAPGLVVADLTGEALAFDQVLDGDLAARQLVAALDDDARGAAPVG